MLKSLIVSIVQTSVKCYSCINTFKDWYFCLGGVCLMEQVSEKSTKVELSLGKKHIKNNEYYLKLVRCGIFKINK